MREECNYDKGISHVLLRT